jgi:hypothetical protein
MPLFLLLGELKLLAGKVTSIVNMLHSVTDIRSMATPEMKLSELHLSVLSNKRMTANEREGRWKNIVVTRSKPLRLGKQKNTDIFWSGLKEVVLKLEPDA